MRSTRFTAKKNLNNPNPTAMATKQVKKTSNLEGFILWISEHLQAILTGLLIPMFFIALPTSIIRSLTTRGSAREATLVLVTSLIVVALLWSYSLKILRKEKTRNQITINYGTLWSTLGFIGLVLYYLHIFSWL